MFSKVSYIFYSSIIFELFLLNPYVQIFGQKIMIKSM